MRRRLAAEGLGTGLLLATVIGSGIMGERRAEGNVALALLANSLATGCMLAQLLGAFCATGFWHWLVPAQGDEDARLG